MLEFRTGFRLGSLLAAASLAGCVQSLWPDRSPRQITAAVKDLTVWPPGLKYHAPQDTAVVLLRGLQRGYVCSKLLEVGIDLSASGTDAVLKAKSRIELPVDGSCPVDNAGLDTAFRVAITLPPQAVLYLETPGGSRTDTLLSVAATVSAESLDYVPSPLGLMASGRFIFRDSTATHKFRSMETDPDSVLACETLHGAVYTRSGDTVRVRFRHILLDAARHPDLQPCLDPRPDTVEAVPDRYGMPRR